MAIRTRLTEALGIEHPVMLAGMGGVSYYKLVAAVSEAGGFGTFGAATMDAQRLVQEINDLKTITSKPFGVDLLTAAGPLEPMVEILIREGASVFVGALGVPLSVIDMCHQAGVMVISMCGKVQHAVNAVEAGCDIVVAQGTEAGGHTGQVATFPLVPQIVDAVGDRVPVVAAGGIYDGRHLAAALALGADGIWVGTRFIATPEARSVPGYKDTLVSTAEDGTVISRAYSGKPMRVVRNEYTAYFEQHPDELKRFPEQLARSAGDNALHLAAGDEVGDIDPAKECFPAGQGTGAIDEIVPAGELVVRFVEEAERTLERLSGVRAGV